MKGQLYLVPTPLGNWDDMSPRALEILKRVDLVAAEDTRVTQQLLRHWQISKPLLSYHEHNARSREALLLRELAAGKNVAQVSDAGMPCISDPGQLLVAAAWEAGFGVTALPGPNAALTCLAASGLDSRRFCFEGFLEASGKERRQALARLAREERTILLYEAPHRLLQTFQDLQAQGLGARLLCIGRELTKPYETYYRDKVSTLEAYFRNEEAPRGEFSLVLEGREAYLARSPEAQQQLAGDEREQARLDLTEARQEGLSLKEAVARVRAGSALSKQEIYRLALELFD